MRAFHNSSSLKMAKLTQVRAHEAADEIIKGRYWEHGKGCAVGCTVHSSDHRAYETEMGIPIALARLEDTIFEGMSNAAAKRFPARFIEAIPVGADLSLVPWKFLHAIVSEVIEKHGTDPVKAGCANAIEVLRLKASGTNVDAPTARAAADAADAAARAAADAAYAAAYAADAAADAAYAADAAARAAADAAYDRYAELLIKLLMEAPAPREAVAA